MLVARGISEGLGRRVSTDSSAYLLMVLARAALWRGTAGRVQDRAMAVTAALHDRRLTFCFDDTPRLLADDLTFTAWGERHRLVAGGLNLESSSSAESHDEVGSHEVWRLPCTTRSLRNPVAVHLTARCYDSEPVLLLELHPQLNQQVLGTEEIASLRISELPGCTEGVIIRQRVDEYGREGVGSWWAQAAFVQDPARAPLLDWGLFAAWRCDDGLCGALVPMRAGGAVARLRIDEGGLSIVASGWCGKHEYPRLPLAVVAFDETPGEAIDRAMAAACGLCEWSFRLRADKPYPPLFEYLGYSTWGGLGKQLDLDAAEAAVTDLKQAGIPVRWLCLDEGWQDLNAAGQLRSFEASSTAFPGGLQAAVRRLQGSGGLRHVAAWATLQGAWGGLDPTASIASDASRTYRGLDGALVPAPGWQGEGFWKDACDQLRTAGIDLLRLDNQGSGRNLYLGRLAIDEGVGESIAAVERAAVESGLALSASMSLHPECLYHYHETNVVRVSADIAPGDRRAAKQHLIHSLQVGAWVSRIAWPDFDGWPTTHPAAEACSVMAALLGGPVYLTDRPGRHHADLARQLCLRDGRLLQPECPAEPLATRWFQDPSLPGELLLAVTTAGTVPRVPASAARRSRPEAWFLGAFNVCADGGSARGEIRLAEIGLPRSGRFAVTSARTLTAWCVDAGETLTIELDELQTELLTIVPIRDGRALLGLRDKLLGVTGCTIDADGLIGLPEPGLIVLYDETGATPESLDHQLYELVADRDPGAREARREGAWWWLGADATVLRMELPR